MKIVLIGIQGSGKSTQGNLLSKQLGLPYLSTGHIFRNIANEKTELGRKVKLIMTSGHLIPDSLTVEIVDTYLSKPEYSKGYILDGFPRTLAQAEVFKDNLDKVIHIEISDKEALWRLAYRNEQRDDDTIDAIKKRIEIFKSFTLPVLNFYDAQKKLITIDGSMAVSDVNDGILKSLGKQLIKNKIKDFQNKKSIIVAVVGMPGSGKTETSNYIRSKNYDVISFSNIVNKKVEDLGLEHTEKNHKKVRMELREKHGFEALAVLSLQTITALLVKSSQLLFIEGMRSFEEYEFIKKSFPNNKVVILCIFADKQLRYARIQKRATRSKLFGEERDLGEMFDLHMAPTIAFADYLITNNKTKDELQRKVDEVLRTILFA